MSKNIEIEVKAIVTKKQFLKIVNYFSIQRKNTYTQKNYYIDDENLNLKNNNLSLRIREKKNFELTLKRHLEVGLEETNQHINKNEYLNFINNKIFPNGEIKNYLKKQNYFLDNFRIIASLETIRTDIKYSGGLLSIDKNMYADKVDYEIEFEYDDLKEGKKILKNLFVILKIPFKENKKSKVARTLKAYKIN